MNLLPHAFAALARNSSALVPIAQTEIEAEKVSL